MINEDAENTDVNRKTQIKANFDLKLFHFRTFLMRNLRMIGRILKTDHLLKPLKQRH